MFINIIIYKNKETIMKNLAIATFVASMAVTSAFAEEAAAPVTGPVLGGSVELKFTEDASGDWGATQTIGASINMSGKAFASFNVESIDGGTATLDEWQLGTTVAPDTTVSIGKQGDVWVSSEGEHTIANPKMDESIQLNMGAFAAAVEFGNFSGDVSDIEAIAGAYTFGAGPATIKGAVDYDLDTKDYTVGARADLHNYGITGTYAEATKVFAYEAETSMGGLTAYLNGDETDMTQNVGASYTYDFNGINLEPSVNYDIDNSDVQPQFVASFSF